MGPTASVPKKPKGKEGADHGPFTCPPATPTGTAATGAAGSHGAAPGENRGCPRNPARPPTTAPARSGRRGAEVPAESWRGGAGSSRRPRTKTKEARSRAATHLGWRKAGETPSVSLLLPTPRPCHGTGSRCGLGRGREWVRARLGPTKGPLPGAEQKRGGAAPPPRLPPPLPRCLTFWCPARVPTSRPRSRETARGKRGGPPGSSWSGTPTSGRQGRGWWQSGSAAGAGVPPGVCGWRICRPLSARVRVCTWRGSWGCSCVRGVWHECVHCVGAHNACLVWAPCVCAGRARSDRAGCTACALRVRVCVCVCARRVCWHRLGAALRAVPSPRAPSPQALLERTGQVWEMSRLQLAFFFLKNKINLEGVTRNW